MELRTAPPDVSDPANWDMQLLVEIPQEDGSMLDTCLQLRDAQLIHEGLPSSFQLRQDDTPLSDAYALRWKLPEVTNINQGLGACFLWSSDERMCQLTPSPALQKTSRSRAHTFHDIYGESDEDELSALGLVADDLVHEWEYTHNMNVLNGVSVQKRWHFYDGGAGRLKVLARLILCLPATRVFNDVPCDAPSAAELILEFVTPEEFEGEYDYQPCVCVQEWPDLFRTLRWGEPAQSSDSD